jgi:hypothetical protein
MEVAVAVGTEIAGELGAKCAIAAALEVGKAAGARAAGNIFTYCPEGSFLNGFSRLGVKLAPTRFFFFKLTSGGVAYILVSSLPAELWAVRSIPASV